MRIVPTTQLFLTSSAGLGTISLVPLRLADINRVVITASVRVLRGTDVHVILNHLQSRLKPFMITEELLWDDIGVVANEDYRQHIYEQLGYDREGERAMSPEIGN